MQTQMAAVLLGTVMLVGLAIASGHQTPSNCPTPSARSVEDLFAPCLARHNRPEKIETTGQR